MAAEEFAAGMLTEYASNAIVGDTTYQDLATGFPVGKRFKSYVAKRRADARLLHLGHQHFADGRYRIYVFADQTAPTADDSNSPVVQWADIVSEAIAKYTPERADENALVDVKVIYQQHHHTYEHADAPRIFRPLNGRYKITNWENVWNADKDQDIFDARGISRDGAVVIVRPDQYVGAVLPLDKPELVDAYFANNLIAQ